MKKLSIALISLSFINFLVITAYPLDLVKKDVNLNQAGPEFSLKTSYESVINLNSAYTFEPSYSMLVPFQDGGGGGGNKTMSIVGAVALAVLGGYLIYKGANYKEGTRTTQVGEGGTGKTSSGGALYYAGGLICLAVSVILVRGALKSNKAMLSYETELKNLSNAQKKLAIR